MNRERSSRVRKFAALTMVVVLTAIVVLAVGQFLSWFSSTQTVTLHAPRAGLVMNPQAKVKLRGIEVGRVSSITSDGEQAVLKLDMRSSDLKRIPANVRADIKSNTIFGAKSVNLVVPDSGGTGQLRGGDVIPTDHVVVELNTVFGQLLDVLAKLEPQKLTATMGAVSGALDGNGEKLGVTLSELNNVLGKTEPHLPQLNQLIEELAGATNVYADAMPNLMRVIDNATVLGDLFVDNTANLDALLINVAAMGSTGNSVLSASKKDLISTLNDLNPLMALLGYQAPGLRCFIVGASNAADIAKPLLGGHNGMLLLDAGLIPGQDPYRYPNDLPLVRGDGPPTCEGGLSNIDEKTPVKFYVIDNAPQPYQPRTTAKVQPFKLFNLLFGGPELG